MPAEPPDGATAERPTAPDGLLIVDKPAGITSHGVVARVRRWAGTRRVGHAGTLDPAATGVLVLGLGRATRLLTYLVGADKTYRATIRLGAATVTDDAEGELLSQADASGVDPAAIAARVAELTGRIAQVPSAVSAIKVDGKRAYARVRAGEQLELPPREVTVHRFELLEQRPAGTALDLDVEVDCSSGTYIRALARDLGAALGVGGHLTALRRTRVGPFDLDRAPTLDQLAEHPPAPGCPGLLSLAEAARVAFPARELDEQDALRLAHGQRLAADPGAALPPPEPTGHGHERPTAAFAPDGRLVALITESAAGIRPVLVVPG